MHVCVVGTCVWGGCMYDMYCLLCIGVQSEKRACMWLVCGYVHKYMCV